VLEEVTTDASGNFVFKNIPGDKNYIVAIDEGDVKLDEGTKVTMSNRAGKELKSFYKSKEPFNFKILSTDKSVLTEMPVEEEPPVFTGQLKSGDKALKNVRVKIVNELGEVIEEATTDEKGNFVFRNIPSDKNYILSIEEDDVKLSEGSKITLASQSGKEVKSFYKNKEEFTFKVLSTDKKVIDEMFVEDVNLVMGIYGYIYNQDKKPLPNAHITVKDEDGSNERHLVTGDGGRFSFQNLSESKNYIFEADANDPNLAGVTRIYIADNKGRIYKVVELMSGKFAFKILEADKSAMGEFEVDEPSLKQAEMKRAERKAEQARKEKEQKAKEAREKALADAKEQARLAREAREREIEEAKEQARLAKSAKEKALAEARAKKALEARELAEAKAKEAEEKAKREAEEEAEMTITLVENIYYAYGDYRVSAEGSRVLDKAAEILNENPRLIMEISSHTDAQSSYGFNLGLSNKRAQAAMEYLVTKGVARKRLKAVGYGETKLMNQCADNVPCSDEEHQVNRRTEFKISKMPKK
jgi:outer membrane protein OmpA-like peptidoglycan-associated protein